MLMKMLAAGGLPVMTDQIRTADAENPQGYFEFERVKDLKKDNDKSWVRGARGKAIKVISHLLIELPAENYYRIILAQRNLSEVILSQNTMLRRRGEMNPGDDEKTTELYKKHLIKVRRLIDVSFNMELLEVGYKDVLDNPRLCAERINLFVGGMLNTEKMSRVVDHQLYRNRSDDTHTFNATSN